MKPALLLLSVIALAYWFSRSEPAWRDALTVDFV